MKGKILTQFTHDLSCTQSLIPTKDVFCLIGKQNFNDLDITKSNY